MQSRVSGPLTAESPSLPPAVKCSRRSACTACDDRAQYADPSLAMGRCLLRLLPEDDFDRQPLSARRRHRAGGRRTSRQSRRTCGRIRSLQATGCCHGRQRHAAGGVAALARTMRRPSFRRLQLRGLEPAGTTSLPGAGSHRRTSSLLRLHGEQLRLCIDAEGSASLCPLWARRWMRITLPAISRWPTCPSSRRSFVNMQRLPSGCALSVHREKTKLWRHWRTDHLADLRLGSPEEYLDCFRERFDQRSTRAAAHPWRHWRTTERRSG